MSTDISDDSLERLSDAASKHLPYKPTAKTLYRWSSTGIYGVVLETVSVGGLLYTSRSRIERFLAETTEARQREVVA